ALDPELESLQAAADGFPATGVCLEHDGVALDSSDSQQSVDLALWLKEKRQGRVTDRQPVQVLAQLTLQERHRVGARRPDEVTRQPDGAGVFAEGPVVLGEVRQGPPSCACGGRRARRREGRPPWPGTR